LAVLIVYDTIVFIQAFSEAQSPAECDSCYSAKLLGILEAAQLAVVATLHQGKCLSNC